MFTGTLEDRVAIHELNGTYADGVGYGRGQRTSGVTDSDTGSYADEAGNGRGRR